VFAYPVSPEQIKVLKFRQFSELNIDASGWKWADAPAHPAAKAGNSDTSPHDEPAEPLTHRSFFAS
jgi:hypothetical protein